MAWGGRGRCIECTVAGSARDRRSARRRARRGWAAVEAPEAPPFPSVTLSGAPALGSQAGRLQLGACACACVRV